MLALLKSKLTNFTNKKLWISRSDIASLFFLKSFLSKWPIDCASPSRLISTSLSGATKKWSSVLVGSCSHSCHYFHMSKIDLGGFGTIQTFYRNLLKSKLMTNKKIRTCVHFEKKNFKMAYYLLLSAIMYKMAYYCIVFFWKFLQDEQ